MPFTVGSLFAGVGGICLGFQQATDARPQFSYKLAWANEIDHYASVTYRANFQHPLLEGDIHKVLHPEEIDFENEKDEEKRKELEEERRKYEEYHRIILGTDIDVLNGGFPCQAFSIAGEQQGFEDKKGRGVLFEEIVDLINQLRGVYGHIPRVLFLENVKNLPSHDHGRTYRIIRERLEQCGYTIYEKVLNTMDYTDLPQNRERIYIVGFRDQADANRFHLFDGDDICGTNLELDALRHDRNKAQWEQITAGLLDYNTVNIQNNSKYYYTPQKYPHYYVAPEDYDGVYDEYHNRVNLAEQVNEMYQFYQIRRGMYVRKNKSNVCPTLTANMGTGGHNVPLILDHSGVRKLTPGETFKLQGFPVGNGYKLPDKVDNKAYADSHLYKQAGNAVSVPMIKLIAEAILAAL